MKRIYINNQIRGSQVQVIAEEGENLGIMTIPEALALAKEKDTDLIEISPAAKPPITKIMDYGKYLYLEKKKAQVTKKKSHITETKVVQLGLNTSEHDLELTAKKASTFLKQGHRVKVNLRLRGRAKYLDRDFQKTRMDRMLKLITESYRIADAPKKSHQGVTAIIERSK